MEKSAVEWLYNQLSLNNLLLNQGTKVHKEMEHKILAKAKEMEKEQREKDFIEGYKKRAKLSGLIFDEASKSSAKELFNKTFKSE